MQRQSSTPISPLTTAPVHPGISRRRLGALALGLGALGLPAVSSAHDDPMGPVRPPRALPAMQVTLHDGRRLPLADVLRGHFTALQLIYTGCSSICPLQGAAFAVLQNRLGALAGRVQLLSLSIDALGDNARTLSAWRQSHGAQAGWLAGVPAVADVDRLLDNLRGRVPGPDRHTAQVFVLDRAGQVVFRCAEFASGEDMARILQDIVRTTAG